MILALRIFLQLLPAVLEIIRVIQRRQLTVEATQEVADAFQKSADDMVNRALLARASVNDSPASVRDDPLNRD